MGVCICRYMFVHVMHSVCVACAVCAACWGGPCNYLWHLKIILVAPSSCSGCRYYDYYYYYYYC